MKTRIIVITASILAMLVGSASAQLFNSTLEVKGFGIEEEVEGGDSIVVIDFDIEDVIRIYADRTYSLYTADGSYVVEMVYKESFTTEESSMVFNLNSEAYSEFLIKGVGKLELDEHDTFFFDEEFQQSISKFLALKTTALRPGETIEGE